MTEQLDILDPTGKHLGVADRATVHGEGAWHQVFHCLVVRSDLPGRVVLQRRHAVAPAYPLHLDLSVTGHLEAGEAPRDGVRELREEIGLDVDPDDLVPLGRRLIADDSGEGLNREITHAFLLPDDRTLEEFDISGCDVEGLVEITTDDVLAMLADPALEVPARELDCDGKAHDITCRQRDLAFADESWVVMTVMADRYARGLRPLAI